MSRARLAAALLVLACALPGTGWGWGSAGHNYIAQNYSQHLPPEIDGLRAWDATVIARVNDPDYRKGYTPGESYKHYMDIDWYPEFLAGTLPHDRAVLELRYGASTVLNNGVLPWAVADVVTTLTQQFQAEQWDAAAITIADLCHYVGDAHQPLHCTKNFDGQYTGNNGIHSRYETTMLAAHIVDLYTDVMPVTDYESPVETMFDLIAASWADRTVILNGDTEARALSGGSYNSLYYEALWHETGPLTDELLDQASQVTASFVYTAWRNAGEPPVPGSMVAVEAAGPGGLKLEAGPTPFRDALTVRYAGRGPLAVEVFDARGARVARLVAGAAGPGRVAWAPRGAGPRAAPGVYFVRLSGAGKPLVRRVLYLP